MSFPGSDNNKKIQESVINKASNLNNFENLSEGDQKLAANKNPLESSSTKKTGSDMDSDSNESESLL